MSPDGQRVKVVPPRDGEGMGAAIGDLSVLIWFGEGDRGGLGWGRSCWGGLPGCLPPKHLGWLPPGPLLLPFLIFAKTHPNPLPFVVFGFPRWLFPKYSSPWGCSARGNTRRGRAREEGGAEPSMGTWPGAL